MSSECYTAITFAPVQGFIEKSRKLRDLYGSSFLISYLAEAICKEAIRLKYKVISPALIKVTQGTPNQIIIQGDFEEKIAKKAMQKAWLAVTENCRLWIQDKVQDCGQYYWGRNWESWGNYAWEFFWGSGETIRVAREAVNDAKRSRDWTGINWTGESSTLSGADGVAWPGMGIGNPQKTNRHKQKQEIAAFYKRLSYELGKAFIDETPELRIPAHELDEKRKEYGEAFVDPDEELSIPELIKRLITHMAIAKQIVNPLKEEIDPKVPNLLKKLEKELNPNTFTDISRLKHKNKNSQESPEKEYWTGWFQGDGDRMGDLLKTFSEDSVTEPDKLEVFSKAMMEWGEHKFKPAVAKAQGRTVYAGGDDFMGIFYRLPENTPSTQKYTPLTGQECVNWFGSKFPSIWQLHGQPITVSVGLVWTAPNVPQRDVLQHCRLAETSAKNNGKDRMAIRILFNGGTHIEWVCPWWCLPVLQHYQDRDGDTLKSLALTTGTKTKPNWTHIYNDVATLESRHAFKGNTQIAEELFKIYFPECKEWIVKDNWWLHSHDEKLRTGILGHEAKDAKKEANELFNEWFINLAKVGFHLCP
ncbi:CRISPR-associated protein Cas10 [Lyngbya sp. CCAP 1446/10]|uniref:Cas10/Cmr2 second palm domain-containing protein n=1 Tax=Lyngbya sp. CCAP 1446/10 TaxID=439293 RepID=UPI002237E383|nr:type III-B CRISPR-associated protein Cas10/Cmr2 [Lyngbya sp. CCAP 1446/10]MCW6051359.1 CRISPR-associated protein Cas10 [Lyngbya sp. CCAP 1446/10]